MSRPSSCRRPSAFPAARGVSALLLLQALLASADHGHDHASGHAPPSAPAPPALRVSDADDEFAFTDGRAVLEREFGDEDLRALFLDDEELTLPSHALSPPNVNVKNSSSGNVNITAEGGQPSPADSSGRIFNRPQESFRDPREFHVLSPPAPPSARIVNRPQESYSDPLASDVPPPPFPPSARIVNRPQESFTDALASDVLPPPFPPSARIVNRPHQSYSDPLVSDVPPPPAPPSARIINRPQESHFDLIASHEPHSQPSGRNTEALVDILLQHSPHPKYKLSHGVQLTADHHPANHHYHQPASKYGPPSMEYGAPPITAVDSHYDAKPAYGPPAAPEPAIVEPVNLPLVSTFVSLPQAVLTGIPIVPQGEVPGKSNTEKNKQVNSGKKKIYEFLKRVDDYVENSLKSVEDSLSYFNPLTWFSGTAKEESEVLSDDVASNDFLAPLPPVYHAPPPPSSYHAPTPTSYQAPLPPVYHAPPPSSYKAPLSAAYQAPQLSSYVTPPPPSYHAPPPSSYVTPPPSYHAPPPSSYVTPFPPSYRAPPPASYITPPPPMSSYEVPEPAGYQAPPAGYQAPVPSAYQAPLPSSYVTPPPAAYQAPVPVTYQPRLPPMERPKHSAFLAEPIPYETQFIPYAPAYVTLTSPDTGDEDKNKGWKKLFKWF